MTAVLTLPNDWAALETESHLEWDLGSISNRREAIEFLLRFENRLCIYSGFVEKLYTSYSFVVPDEDKGSLTILPDERNWHDTLHGIPEEAVEETGIHIMPGETMGHAGLYLKVPGLNRLAGSKELPFREGLKELVARYRAAGDTFLPVLIKGDLREYESRLPSLHLHRIRLDRLEHLSVLSRQTIKGAIADHLIALFRDNS